MLPGAGVTPVRAIPVETRKDVSWPAPEVDYKICLIVDLLQVHRCHLQWPHSARESRLMIDLYFAATPNGLKIKLFFEETGLPYHLKPISLSKGEQFQPDFLAISPNNKIPAIVDNAPLGGGAPISLFESGAILLYLAEKS